MCTRDCTRCCLRCSLWHDRRVGARSDCVPQYSENRTLTHFWQDIQVHFGSLNIQLNKWENILFRTALCNKLCSNTTTDNALALLWQPTSAFVMYSGNIRIALAQRGWPSTELVLFPPNISTAKAVLHMHLITKGALTHILNSSFPGHIESSPSMMSIPHRSTWVTLILYSV